MTTKRVRRIKPVAPLTAFWDTSGVVPLCCLQSQSAPARQTARVYARAVVWWATPVEAISSFNRLKREGHLTAKDYGQASARLDHLRRRWSEIQPTEEVRRRAERLLGAHKLRAADALQLSAALVWCSNHPRGRVFIGADGQLSDAAEGEGFTVIRLL
ncbi:MAG TPA: type II toxin-antitoxin system VapC family toxin [Blastocatellia bacterium]|nr:type II toxin-antitoxin system VapC family toxin [Blastocatellia bacterium]